MKKLGKKLNYFTKVFLVLCLLFSNLSSLKVVFAYEGEEETVVNETVETDEILEETTENNEDEEEALQEENDEETQLTDEENTDEEEETDKETSAEKTEENSETDETQGEEFSNNDEEVDKEIKEGYDYTSALNESAAVLGLNSLYSFEEVDGEKNLYVLLGVNEEEVLNIVDNAFDDVTGEVVEDELVLTQGEEVVTYKVIVYNEEYLLELIKLVVGNEESTLDTGDVNKDNNVDAYDVIYLDQILKNGFGVDVVGKDVTIESKFDEDTKNVSVGDTFTVEYVLTLSEDAVNGITGIINYNKDMLSLDNVEVKNFETGEVYDGHFLYLGDYIVGVESVTEDEEGNEVVSYIPTDYVVVVMTFTALENGSDTVSISDVGYFYDNVYYEGNSDVSVDVTVLSDDNNLSSLTVAGNAIVLDEDTTEYELTVSNDVTSVDLEYILSDLSASISSIVAPEELAVGENTITIVVVAENGEEKTYTITVTREDESEETEEEKNTVTPVTYQENNTNNSDKEVEKDTPKEDEKVVKEVEKDTKDENKLSRVIIIILILLAIAGLIYLIFKDDDEESKKANKEVNKLKKQELKADSNSKKVNNSKKTDKKER